MDLEKLRKYYNDCKPSEALEHDDPRNIDVDSLVDDDEQLARGERWSKRFARQIELCGRNTTILEYFTGLTGSGKSTELLRLAATLRREDGLHLLPVIVDAERLLDIHNPIDIPDIMLAVLHEAERQVRRAEGKSGDDGGDGFFARFWHWATSTDVELKKVEIEADFAGIEGKIGADIGDDKTGIGIEAKLPGGGGKLLAEMKTRDEVRQRVRRAVAAHLTSFLKDVRKELEALEARSRECKSRYAGLIVIVDSLEKLRGTESNWTKVLESAEQIFSNGAPMLKLPVHTIYTIPPAVALRLKLDPHYLPMIKLRESNDREFKPGFDAAREIIRGRIPDEDLAELLGADDLEERVKELIEWTGGFPREIVRFLQNILETDRWPLSEKGLERIRERNADSYRRLVRANASAIDWLAGVGVTKRLVMASDTEWRHASRMLENSVVLRYMNHTEWFDLHPAVYDMPELQEAMRLRKDQR